jgi:hypothetical protein
MLSYLLSERVEEVVYVSLPLVATSLKEQMPLLQVVAAHTVRII